jgi:hypothetical protein
MLTRRFAVPGRAADVFAAVQALSDIAGCVPGLAITRTDGTSSDGTSAGTSSDGTSTDGEVVHGRLTARGSSQAGSWDVGLRIADVDRSAQRMTLSASGVERDGSRQVVVDVVTTVTAVAPGQPQTSEVAVVARTSQPLPDATDRQVWLELSGRMFDQFICNLQGMLGDPGIPVSTVAARNGAAPDVARPNAAPGATLTADRDDVATNDSTNTVPNLIRVAERALPVVVALSIGVVIGRTISNSHHTTKERT